MKASKHIIWTLVIALMLSAGAVIMMPEQAQAATKTVNITKKKFTLIAGTKCQIKAKFGKKTITKAGKWSTSNRKVATVNKKGVVIAKATGTARIKVKYKKKSQVITITVRKPKKKPVSNKTCRHNWTIISKPDCGRDGWRTCSICNKEERYAKATGKHNWKITAKLSCAYPGQRKCSVCGNYEELGKPLGHDWEDHSEIYENGSGEPYTSTRYNCQKCNIEFPTYEEGDAHVMDEDGGCYLAEITTSICHYTYPKTDTIQETYKTCKRCGYETEHETKVINTEDKIFYDWK